MKIDSLFNPAGPYFTINGGEGLSYTKNASNAGSVARLGTQVSRIANPDFARPASNTSSTTGLTNAERAYFAKLFPDSVSQINSHKTYSPSGINSSIDLGQIINRKV